MKIALLTYFAADNYGATLQAYATVKALEKCGHEVELINFVIPEPVSSFAKKIMLYPKHIKFERFRDKYFHRLTRSYKTIAELQSDPPKADCYLVGSDQTWNPDISDQMAQGFFLAFGGKDVIRASYAASFGKDKWEDTKWINSEDVKRLLSDFDFVSVRETSGIKLLSEQFEVENATQVLDPVLLFEEYPELTSKIASSDEIILYKLVNSAEFYTKCRDVGHHLSLPLRSIGSLRRIKGVRCGYPESLEAWIRRIAGARYVITDSFHGTVISLLYRKQFVSCIAKPERVTRLKSLLDILGLSDRFMPIDNDYKSIVAKLQEPIDYNSVHEKLTNLREQSFRYIHKIGKGNNG